MLTLSNPSKDPVPNRFYGDKPVSGVSVITHLGNDYGWGNGTGIYAAADGVVMIVSVTGDRRTDNRNGGYGNYIQIDHGDGYVTLYAHIANSGSKVSKGDRVKRGQLIATMGNTGNAAGVHLHFELRHNGRIIDPNPFLSEGTVVPADSGDKTPFTPPKEIDDMYDEAAEARLFKKLENEARRIKIYTLGTGLVAVGPGGSSWVIPSDAYVTLMVHLEMAAAESTPVDQAMFGFLVDYSRVLSPDPEKNAQMDKVVSLSEESVNELVANLGERTVILSEAQEKALYDAARSGATDAIKNLSFVTVVQ